jgi:hypothetical protein
MLSFRILMTVLVLATASPLLARYAAATIAHVYGCTPGMAATKPCVVGGVDLSDFLEALDKVSAFLFATLPLLMALVLAWVLTELGSRYVNGRM